MQQPRFSTNILQAVPKGTACFFKGLFYSPFCGGSSGQRGDQRSDAKLDRHHDPADQHDQAEDVFGLMLRCFPGVHEDEACQADRTQGQNGREGHILGLDVVPEVQRSCDCVPVFAPVVSRSFPQMEQDLMM